jgi:hypothetical protein
VLGAGRSNRAAAARSCSISFRLKSRLAAAHVSPPVYRARHDDLTPEASGDRGGRLRRRRRPRRRDRRFRTQGWRRVLRIDRPGLPDPLHALSVHFEATCLPGAGSVAPAFPFNTLTIKHGAFAGDSSLTTPGSSMSIRLEGSFDGTKATGKVIGRESIKSLGSCKQTEPFTAHVK